MENTARVQKTSDFCLLEKRSAVDRGYYEDEFIKYFTEHTTQSTILNILHYLRTMTVRTTLNEFCETFKDEKVQFVNLGCGFDTSSFNLLNKHENVVCYETDFETQLKLKSQIMSDNDCFKQLLTDTTLDNGYVRSERYKMVPFDLTKVNEFDRLVQSGLSPDLPTIFLAEVVFPYVETNSANAVIKLLSDFANKNSVLLYLQPLFRDSLFGNMVKSFYSNLRIKTYSMDLYNTVESQIKRYENENWKVKVACFNDFFNNNFDENERKRVLELENFKDFKELGTWCSHVILGLCYKDESRLSKVLKLFDTSDDTSNNTPENYKIPFGKNYDNSTEFDPNFMKSLFIGNIKASVGFDKNAYLVFDEVVKLNNQ